MANEITTRQQVERITRDVQIITIECQEAYDNALTCLQIIQVLKKTRIPPSKADPEQVRPKWAVKKQSWAGVWAVIKDILKELAKSVANIDRHYVPDLPAVWVSEDPVWIKCRRSVLKSLKRAEKYCRDHLFIKPVSEIVLIRETLVQSINKCKRCQNFEEGRDDSMCKVYELLSKFKEKGKGKARPRAMSGNEEVMNDEE